MKLARRDRDGDDIPDQADLCVPPSDAENVHLVIVGKAHPSPSLGQKSDDVRSHRDWIRSQWRPAGSYLVKFVPRHRRHSLPVQAIDHVDIGMRGPIPSATAKTPPGEGRGCG